MRKIQPHYSSGSHAHAPLCNTKGRLEFILQEVLRRLDDEIDLGRIDDDSARARRLRDIRYLVLDAIEHA